MSAVASKRRVVPGFGLSLGYSVLYLTFIVLIPLSALFFKTAGLTWAQFVKVVTARDVMSAYKVSFGASIIAGLASTLLGLLVAWVLGRYQFLGRRLIDALIDLPFALPTAVAGIALTTLWADNGWLGQAFSTGIPIPWFGGVHHWILSYPDPTWHGFSGGHAWPFVIIWRHHVAFTPLGITLALIFIGLPFVIRTVQPVLQDMGKEVEEAAVSLGASRLQTFRRIIFPELLPALLTGFALSVARGLGEYGSVVFISGNLRNFTEIAPLKIIQKLEQNNAAGYSGATAIAIVVLTASFLLLLAINLLQRLVVRK
jgi:sulfate transport system permease protein